MVCLNGTCSRSDHHSDILSCTQASRPKHLAAVSSDGWHFITDEMQADVIGSRLVEEICCCRVDHVATEIFPCIALRKNVFGEALGTVTPVGFLHRLEYQIGHKQESSDFQ